MALRPDNEKTKHNIMVKRFLIQTAPGIAAAVLGLALPLSCVNEEYDISKVDTTVSLGGNALVFPLGTTEQLKLNTLLSEEDFEYITSLDGGVYAFTVSDEMDLSDDIPDVISEFKVDPITIDLSVEAVAGSKARDTESILSDEVSDISAVSPRVIRFERTFEKRQEITIMDLEELPEELKDMTVEDVVLSETELHMTFTVRTVPDIGSTPHIDLSVYLPEEIMTDDERVDENNVFRISEDLENNEFTMEPIAVTGLNLKNVDFSAGGTVNSSVRVEGTVSVENPVIDDPADLETVGIWLDITGGIPAVNISEITGYVDCRLGSDSGENMNQSISLEELPDFVKGEDFILDFANPHIKLTVNSNLQMPVKGELKITPVFVNVADEASAQTIALSIPASDASGRVLSYWIANDRTGMPDGYEFLEADVRSLTRRIPDTLQLEITAGTDPESLSTITAGYENSLLLNYEVEIPFEFGEETDIRMDYTIPGDKDDAAEGSDQENDALPPVLGELLNMNAFGLGGYVESSLPLKLELTMDLLDSRNEIIRTEPASLLISEGTPENPVKSPVDLTLKLADGEDGTDLTKIRMNFRVTSGNMTGEPVTEESYLQAVLKVKVPGGITIDLSSLGENENNTDSEN